MGKAPRLRGHVAESGHMLRGAGETHDCRIERAHTMDSRRLVYNCMTMRTLRSCMCIRSSGDGGGASDVGGWNGTIRVNPRRRTL